MYKRQGDSPAAMRYTEARLNKLGEAMMDDLYKETVDFEPNFDNTLVEPTVVVTGKQDRDESQDSFFRKMAHRLEIYYLSRMAEYGAR